MRKTAERAPLRGFACAGHRDTDQRSYMRLTAMMLVGGCAVGWSCSLAAQPVAVSKTNPMPVYVHYMPWFQTPETLGGTTWGWHWTMNNRNPNVIGANGQRQIASRYYPLIGPYDSSNRDVIEYHMLLM